MATIYKLSSTHWTVKFDQPINPDEGIKAFLVVADRGGYQLSIAEKSATHITYVDPSAMYLRSVLIHKKSPQLVITTDGMEPLINEALHGDGSCYAEYIDFAASDSFGLWGNYKYQKPREIAVFTSVYNEDLFVDIFCKHYSKLTNPSNIFLIDHESDDLTFYQIARNYGCQIIRIPRGFTDESNRRKFTCYFQRFLLAKYKWVIYVDADELIVHEKGFEHLRNLLLNDDWEGIYAPQHGYEVFHHPDEELPLNASQPITLQRNYLHPSKAYAKPVISSEKAFWGPGFHYALNTEVREIENLWMLHLGHVSVEVMLQRDLARKNQKRSDGDKAMKMFEPDLIDPQKRLEEITKEHRDTIAQAHIMMPDWMKNTF